MSPELSHIPSETISRRAFLGGMAAAGAVIAMGIHNAEPVQAEVAPEQQNNAASQPRQTELASTGTQDKPSIIREFPKWYEQFVNPSQSYLTSGKQELLASAVAMPAIPLLRPLGIRVGNAGLSELLRDPDYLQDVSIPNFAFIGTIKAPVKEELLFRAAPSAALNIGARLLGNKNYQSDSPQLAAGIVTSAVFAHSHNKGAEQKSLPLPQFLVGMTSWRLARKAGIKHAVAGHAIHNAAAFSILTPMVWFNKRALNKQPDRSQA